MNIMDSIIIGFCIGLAVGYTIKHVENLWYAKKETNTH